MSEYAEVIAEFLVESREGLDQLERDLVSLEETPSDREILARVFRCFHTIKGTSGFLGYGHLEELTHAGENLLSRLRDGELSFSGDLAGTLLETVDAVRSMLGEVEASGNDGTRSFDALTNTLKELCAAAAAPAAPATQPQAVPAPVKPEHVETTVAAPRAVLASAPQAQPATPQHSANEVAESPAGDQLAAAQARPTHSADLRETPKAHEIGEAVEHPSGRAEDAKASDGAHRPVAAAAENVRVDVALLDDLMDLAGELVLIRNHLSQLTKHRDDPQLVLAAQRLSLITGQMQHEIMRLRMQPVSNLLNKLPRMVRDLARSCRKLVRLELDARNTELDKSLIEAIKDPMTHLLRNCVDHGIEAPEVRTARGKHPEGRILIRSFHQNGLVHIEVSDDGGGIPLDKVRQRAVERGIVSQERAEAMSNSEAAGLIFLAGFSTANEVTHVSGRGVGMDVVKTNVEQIGGTVDVDTKAGRGTTFTLKVPLTLAIVPALITRCMGERYAIPQVSVLEVMRLSTLRGESSIEWFHGAPVYRLRGKLLPLVFLAEILGGPRMNPDAAPADPDDAPTLHMAVLQGAGRLFGLVVDAIMDQQEIVAKPLPAQLRSVRAFSGATLLGDGRVALILDALAIAQQARVASELREDGLFGRVDEEVENVAPTETLLLFRGSDDERYGVALDSLSRLETFEVAALEGAGSHEVVQYRGELLPIFPIKHLLPERRKRLRNPAPEVESQRPVLDVIVLGEGARSVGIVVDDVLDVVETNQAMRRQGCRDGVKATVVLQGRVTEVIDVAWVVTEAHGHVAASERMEQVS